MTRCLLIIFSILFAAAFLSSCGEYEALDINKKAKRSADSLFRANKDSLKVLSDTLCLDRYDQYYKLAYDSLKKEGLEKANKLFEK